MEFYVLNLIDRDKDCYFWLNETRLYSARQADQEADLETRLLLDESLIQQSRLSLYLFCWFGCGPPFLR